MERFLLLLTLLLPTLLTAQETPADEPAIITPPTYDSAAIAAALVYPPEALAAGKGGIVFVGVVIDSTGKSVKVGYRGETAFGSAASEAFIKREGFRPALLDGKPIASQATFRIRFAYDTATKRGTTSISMMDVDYGDAMDLASQSMATYDPKELVGMLTYPLEALELGIEGRVLVEAHVDEKGTLISATIITRAHPLLDTEALRAVKELRFTPAVRDGVATEGTVTIPVTFRLED